MSLAALVSRIQAEGEASAAQIRALADAQVAQILAEAGREAQRLFAEAEQAAAQAQPAELGRLHNQARFRALCLTSQARDALVERVLERVHRQMAQARSNPGYPTLLGSLLDELIPRFHNAKAPGEGYVLEADAMDQVVLTRLLAERGMSLPVDYCLDCWGGLNARAIDGSVMVMNTLESRLARATPYVRQRLAAWIDSGFLTNP